ncbi:hypothetical protein HK405_002268, partial [Cladochytrium tenue]
MDATSATVAPLPSVEPPAGAAAPAEPDATATTTDPSASADKQPEHDGAPAVGQKRPRPEDAEA